MQKFFKDREDEDVKLSVFLEELKQGKDYFDERKSSEVQYLMEYLTDVSMPKDIITVLCSCFHTAGGRYSVRSDIETIKGLYEIVRRFPKLSATAVDNLISVYIEDAFVTYDLVAVLEKFIKIFGETDEAFIAYMAYVETKEKELQEKYDENAKKAYDLESAYPLQFIQHLEYLISSKHIPFEVLDQCLPTAELIHEDIKHLTDLSYKYRIFMGCGRPISYQMVECLAKKNDLKDFPIQPEYYISTTKETVPACFTKEQFLESVEQRKFVRE